MKKRKCFHLYQSLLSENPEDPGAAFCRNVNICKEAAGYTLQDLVDGTGLPVSVIKSVLYYENKDYKIGTAAKLAQFFDLSIDELTGAGSLSAETKQAIQQVRAMPLYSREFVYWLVEFIYSGTHSSKNKKKVIPVLCPEFVGGCLSFDFNQFTDSVDVSGFNDRIRPKLFMGLKIPGRAFLPRFAPGDVLLLANDRHPLEGEIVAIYTEGHIWFAQYQFEPDTRAGFYKSIYGTHPIPPDEVEKIVGYVAAVFNG